MDLCREEVIDLMSLVIRLEIKAKPRGLEFGDDEALEYHQLFACASTLKPRFVLDFGMLTATPQLESCGSSRTKFLNVLKNAIVSILDMWWRCNIKETLL